MKKKETISEIIRRVIKEELSNSNPGKSNIVKNKFIKQCAAKLYIPEKDFKYIKITFSNMERGRCFLEIPATKLTKDEIILIDSFFKQILNYKRLGMPDEQFSGAAYPNTSIIEYEKIK